MLDELSITEWFRAVREQLSEANTVRLKESCYMQDPQDLGKGLRGPI